MAPSEFSTYGTKPAAFDLDGERYYLGADIGRYLKCFRGSLFKRYPTLFHRNATAEEKQKIAATGALESSPHSSVVLVKESEIEDLLSGNEDKYRSGGAGIGITAEQPIIRQENMVVAKPRMNQSWANSQVSSGTHHLESIPCSTPASGGRGRNRQRNHIHNLDYIQNNDLLLKNAEIVEELVPIRLDMDIEGIRLRDTFCYNKNETLITPEMIAEIICDDLDLPAAAFLIPITTSIQNQIDAHQEVVPLEETPDQRAIIKLNIHVGNESLTDQFEWDISNKDYSPEEFARQLCTDLSIGGEFEGAIAYSVRGQISWNQRTYAYSEAPLPKIETPFRNALDLDNWFPNIETLSDAEVEKKMRDQDRNTRRMRRLVNANPYGGL